MPVAAGGKAVVGKSVSWGSGKLVPGSSVTLIVVATGAERLGGGDTSAGAVGDDGADSASTCGSVATGSGVVTKFSAA